MSGRHQVFVIAKVNNQRYRSLSAIHIPYIGSDNVATLCVRLVDIFQYPGNRPKLELEVAYAGTLTDDQWEDKNVRWNKPMFPFVATCLIIGSAMDGRLVRQVKMPPWNIAFNQAQNDTGITVVDITDPTTIRHCLVILKPSTSTNMIELGDNKEVIMVPLSLSEYMRRYSLPDCWGEGIRREIESLIYYPLIDADTLNEAWRGQFVGAEAGRFRPLEKRGRRGWGQKGTQKILYAEKRSQRRSAIRHSHDACIEDFLRTTSNEDLRIRVERLEFSIHALKTYLYNNPHWVVDHDHGVEILGLALQLRPGSVVKLHPFVSMTGNQVMQLLKSAEGECKASEPFFKVLDISFNQKITIEELRPILEIKPVGTLRAWNNPLLPTEELKQLVQSKHMKTLQDSHLFLESFPGSGVKTGPLSHVQDKLHVRQLIWICSSAHRGTLARGGPMCMDDCDVEMLYDVLSRSRAKKPDKASELYVRLLSLQLIEAHMNVSEIFVVITRLMQYLCYACEYGWDSDALKSRVAPLIPIMFGSGNFVDPYHISPIPPRMLYDRLMRRNYEAGPLYPLQRGEYTIVLIQEPHLQRFRYGFVTSDAHGKIRILSALGVSAETLPKAIDHWDRGAHEVMTPKQGDRGTWVRAWMEVCEKEVAEKIIEVARRYGEEFGELGDNLLRPCDFGYKV